MRGRATGELASTRSLRHNCTRRESGHVTFIYRSGGGGGGGGGGVVIYGER